MRIFLFLLLVAVIGLLAYIRLAPSDPARWHVDPAGAEDPGEGGVLMTPPDAPVLATTPETLMELFDAIAMAEPRITRLAGSVAEGHVTYVARTAIMSFPDYISVRALPAEGGATLAVISRLRFGRSDMGVNRARLDRWMAELGERVGE